MDWTQRFWLRQKATPPTTPPDDLCGPNWDDHPSATSEEKKNSKRKKTGDKKCWLWSRLRFCRGAEYDSPTPSRDQVVPFPQPQRPLCPGEPANTKPETQTARDREFVHVVHNGFRTRPQAYRAPIFWPVQKGGRESQHVPEISGVGSGVGSFWKIRAWHCGLVRDR
jgi:hypothetical protein